jgi:hypothetical protein
MVEAPETRREHLRMHWDMSEMTISPDGGTLFLVGTTSVVTPPAP